MQSSTSTKGRVLAVWGVGGVVLLLAQALTRLAPMAFEAVTSSLSALQWVALGAWVIVMAYAEGYRGFHRRFAPRVVARAMHLAKHPTWARGLLAPAFCMSLFAASRRGLIVSWSLVVGIVSIVALVRTLSQPWRGIVDSGVVVGLGIGTLSLGYHAVRAWRGTPPAIDADVPTRAARTPAGAAGGA